MSQRPNKPAPVVVKRPPDQRRKLPPDLEAFARSDDEKLRIRRPRVDRGLIRDPREGYTVAGVANRDARAVYDVRSVAMRALWDEGAADERALATLGQLFHDALRLELWHARRLTSFAAFAEEVVGVPVDRAEALADEAALRTGEPATPLTEVAIALWLRTEAGLYEGDEGGRARVRSGERGLVLELVVDLVEASTALAGVGARHLPLARSLPAREQERGGSHDERRSYDEPRAARPAHVERARPEPRIEVADYDEVADERDEPSHSELPAAEELESLDELDAREELDAGEEGESLELEERESLEVEALDEGESLSDESLDARAPAPVVGGARLLTRKPYVAQEEAPSDSPDEEAGELWGRREPRPERPATSSVEHAAPRVDRGGAPRVDRGGAPRVDRAGERPKFGGNDRGGERPKFGGNDRGGERPKFGGNDRGGERPKFGGGNERPRFGGGDNAPRAGGFTQAGGDRPRFGGSEQPARAGGFTIGNERSGGGGDRPRFGGGNERSGGGGDRPRFGGGNERSGGGDRPRFGTNEKPQRAGGFVQGGKPAPAKFAGAGGKPAAGKGFGARQSFSGNASTGRDRDPTQASPRRDDDSEA